MRFSPSSLQMCLAHVSRTKSPATAQSQGRAMQLLNGKRTPLAHTSLMPTLNIYTRKYMENHRKSPVVATGSVL